MSADARRELSGVLFHIVPAADWAERTETYQSQSFERDGFIHCSTAAQVDAVAKRLFRGRDDLLVLTLDPSRIRAQVRYENLEGGEEKYPHIYGPLNVDAVVTERVLQVGEDGGLHYG